MRAPLTISLCVWFVAAAGEPDPQGRLYFLDIRGKRVVSVKPDGSDVKTLVTDRNSGPDGIAIDLERGHIYWTNMGTVSKDDGSIERSDLNGSNLTTVVPAGGTFTPKQLKIDSVHRKLYWSDREGMRVMRAGLDGSRIETLVETAQGDAARRDARNWCVGLALDVARGRMYWTQKGSGGNGSIRRAGMEIPKGQSAANRKDIETLLAGLPEPIDLDLDLEHRLMYWTDRGDPPRGNTVNRAPMDSPRQSEILVNGLKEGIGIALDLPRGRMFFTDLGGNVYSANLDGTSLKSLLAGQGTLTGIAFAVPSRRP